LAEFVFVDGTALTPSSFGETNSDGVWVAKAISGLTYGTNGFYLNFKDAAVTAGSNAGLGKDVSGNGNYWNTINVSTASGVTYDQMTDTPTNNYATLNSIAKAAGTFTEANLKYDGGSGNNQTVATIAIPKSGKWFLMIQRTSGASTTYPAFGIAGLDNASKIPNASGGTTPGDYSDGAAFLWNGAKRNSLSDTASYWTPPANGSWACIAFDAATGKIWVGTISGTTITWVGDPAGDTSPAYTLSTTSTHWLFGLTGNDNSVLAMEFGQRNFHGVTPPTGFKALCTANLPSVAITKPKLHFAADTYTGNAGSLVVRDSVNSGYNEAVPVTNSLRFDGVDARLSRSFGSGGNRRKWTWSGWVKRSQFGSVRFPLLQLGTASSDSTYFSMGFHNTTLDDSFYVGGGLTNWRISNAIYRDPSTHYHVVVAIDVDNGTANNRIRVWIQGVEITSWNTINNPSAIDLAVNQSGVTHYMGFNEAGTNYGDGYLSNIHFIDNQALTASDFGQFDADNIWVPKAYTGSYGTTSFYLDFSTTTNTTTLGEDAAGTNDWTLTGMTRAAGADECLSSDTPTNNFCVINAVRRGTAYRATISNGGLVATAIATATQHPALSTLAPRTGKWYFEVVFTAISYIPSIGVNDPAASLGNGDDWRSYQKGASLMANGTLYTNSVSSSPGYTFAVNDCMMVAFDVDVGKLWIGKNGTWFNSGNPAAGTGQVAGLSGYSALTPIIDTTYSGGADVAKASFGQAPLDAAATWSSTAKGYFKYDPASYNATGFKALCSDNLPDQYDFAPDLIWLKNRINAVEWVRVDSVRGWGVKSKETLAGEVADVNVIDRVLDGGYVVGNSANSNTSNNTYVGYSWKAGGAPTTDNAAAAGAVPTLHSVKIDGVSSTAALAGTMQITRLSANTTAGCSIVTYTGTGSAKTIPHCLGVAPSMIIVKARTVGYNWTVYHKSASDGYLYMNTTDTKQTAVAATVFGNGTIVVNPDSTVFSVGSDGIVNYSTYPMMAYCFAEIPGYSKFGSYTGNGSSDGPFVYCGFRPRYVLIKNTSAAAAWYVYDTARDTYNLSVLELNPNNAQLEESNLYGSLDITSNGFKLRFAGGEVNNTTNTFIFAAFAEHPFGGSNVSPAPAR
jgi:hypothetical protein